MQISKAMGWDDEGYFSLVSSLQYTFTTFALLKDCMLKSVPKHYFNLFWRTGIALESLMFKKTGKYSVQKFQVKPLGLFIIIYLILFN